MRTFPQERRLIPQVAKEIREVTIETAREETPKLLKCKKIQRIAGREHMVEKSFL